MSAPAIERLRPEDENHSREQKTAELLRRANACDDPIEKDRLVNEVVILNMRVARAIVQRFRGKGIADDDLLQVAYMALIRAARKFDVTHERDFLAFAVPTIRGELKKHFRDSGWVVRPPRRIQELQRRIAAAREDLSHRLARSPRPSEIADELGEDVEDIIDALATDGAFQPLSLDAPCQSDTTMSVGESLADTDSDMAASEARLIVEPLLRRLTPRDRRILELRFFHDATQQQIADDIGVTQMHVSRLLARVLGQLRQELADGEQDAPRAAEGAVA